MLQNIYASFSFTSWKWWLYYSLAVDGIYAMELTSHLYNGNVAIMLQKLSMMLLSSAVHNIMQPSSVLYIFNLSNVERARVKLSSVMQFNWL